MLSLVADMSVSLNFHERSFVCDVINCHQKFISASAVARHVARIHKTHGNNNGKVEIGTLYLHKFYGNLHGSPSKSASC